MITQVLVPRPAAGARSIYIKQGEKESFDWPIADVAVVMNMDGATCRKASIVMGAASPVPHRAKAAEAALAGQAIDERLAREAANKAVAGATPLANNRYKVKVFEAIVRRAIMEGAKA
jgi:xanthine dehydrogenase YagS FAD-binding subunit